MPGDVESEIGSLKRELGVELDRDLAAALGVDPSTVAGWRRRGGVPERYRLRAMRVRDEAAAEGVADKKWTGLREAYIFSLLRFASDRLASDLGGRGEYDEIWAGFRLARLYEFAQRELDGRGEKDAWRLRYEELKREIAGAGEVAIWLETLR